MFRGVTLHVTEDLIREQSGQALIPCGDALQVPQRSGCHSVAHFRVPASGFLRAEADDRCAACPICRGKHLQAFLRGPQIDGHFKNQGQVKAGERRRPEVVRAETDKTAATTSFRHEDVKTRDVPHRGPALAFTIESAHQARIGTPRYSIMLLQTLLGKALCGMAIGTARHTHSPDARRKQGREREEIYFSLNHVPPHGSPAQRVLQSFLGAARSRSSILLRRGEIPKGSPHVKNRCGALTCASVPLHQVCAIGQKPAHQLLQRERVLLVSRANLFVEGLPHPAADVWIHRADARAHKGRPARHDVRHAATNEFREKNTTMEFGVVADNSASAAGSLRQVLHEFREHAPQ